MNKLLELLVSPKKFYPQIPSHPHVTCSFECHWLRYINYTGSCSLYKTDLQKWEGGYQYNFLPCEACRNSKNPH